MKNFDDRLYQIIEKSKFVKKEDLNDAYKSSKELNRPLSDIVVFRSLITEDALSQLIAEGINIPYVSLKNKIIPEEFLGLVPENLARHFRMIPFQKDEKGISLAMEDPENFEAIELVKRRVNLPVIPYYTSKIDIIRSLNQYKRDINKKFENIISENLKKVTLDESDNVQKLIKRATDIPVIKILDAILEYGVAENASDLHLELVGDSLLVRLRIDGILHDILNMPKEIQPAIVARIKVLSNLKIDEHRVPQDGRFKFQIDENMTALRVSVVPAFYGENIVLRILSESERPLNLEELGISGLNLELIRKNMDKPHGMILVTGPTGSGKTTTLYSVLNILNTPEVKICTIEDPIEYGVTRINQIQVNPQAGLTFANGLRSLLRHDPDIIMVGEIRDNETAEMAIHSALTGHLVLSTLHTNDAASTIPRFLDMGAEGYLIASTLNIVIAQRLVRRICSSCIEELSPPKDVLAHFEKITGKDLSKQKFFKGKGCDKCRSSGYKGRIGIYEIMENNDEIKKLTLSKSDASEVFKIALKNGMITMLNDGLDKVSAGLTTIEEVLAAVRE